MPCNGRVLGIRSIQLHGGGPMIVSGTLIGGSWSHLMPVSDDAFEHSVVLNTLVGRRLENGRDWVLFRMGGRTAKFEGGCTLPPSHIRKYASVVMIRFI